MAKVTLVLTDTPDLQWPTLRVICDRCEGEVTPAVLLAAQAVDKLKPFVSYYETQTPDPPDATGAVDSSQPV